MKKVFIYYSLTGNGDMVSDYFKENGYDIRKVITKYKYPKKMFPLMMIGGFKALTKMKDKLIDFDNDISNYDEIVIGSPIWFDRVCAPINSALNKLDLTNKKVSFVFYSGSGTGEHAKEFIKNNYPNANIMFIKEPKKYKDEIDKIKLYEE